MIEFSLCEIQIFVKYADIKYENIKPIKTKRKERKQHSWDKFYGVWAALRTERREVNMTLPRVE